MHETKGKRRDGFKVKVKIGVKNSRKGHLR